MAQVIDPEVLAEWLDDDRAAERIVAVVVSLHNRGPDSYTVTPSHTALVGPRRQRIRPLEPSALAQYMRPGSQRGGFSTPPFVSTQQASERAVVTEAGDKALRPRVLAPGDASEGWLYFPISGNRAAGDITRRWHLAVAFEDQQRHWREYLIRIDPPDEPA
jgi:hypothetical protein